MSDQKPVITNLGLSLDAACRAKRNNIGRPFSGKFEPLIEPLRTHALTEYATTGISVRALAQKYNLEVNGLHRAITVARREGLAAAKSAREL